MESLSCMAISTAKRGLLHLNLWAVCHCVAERFTVFVLVLDCVMHYKIDSTGCTRVDLILSEGALMPLQAWNGLDDFGKVVSKHGSSAAIFVIFRDSRGSCSRPAFARNMPDFKLAVDKNNKATELALLRVCGTVQQNPHMRAFWASTISCFLAFLGWFALAPLALEVATSMGTCENQLYPPEDNPKRVAYLKYKSLKTGKAYCQ